MESDLRAEFSTIRTDSVYRKLFSSLMQAYAKADVWQFWFNLAGSLFDDTMSTLDVPDIDLLAVCDLTDMTEKFGLEVRADPRLKEYFRIKKTDECCEEKLLPHLRGQLHVSTVKSRFNEWPEFLKSRLFKVKFNFATLR